jgi:glutaminyl-tRNA synthetase
MPTIVGIRRRGFTPESIRLLCDRVGVAKADQWIDYSVLEAALRDDLEPKAPRVAAVLDPLRLIIDNFPEGLVEESTAPVHPQRPELGRRAFPISRELWIERDDFSETPPKGYFRLYPGNRVRLRHGYVIECKHADKDATGRVVAVHADYFPDSKSGTDGANTYKVKGNIHWVSIAHALPVEVRLYDRLFTDPQPDSGSKNFLDYLNPESNRIITAYVEPGVGAGPNAVQPEDRLQFERHGYFVADHVDSRPGKPVFNRIVTLKDAWQSNK